jgi:hypothetical protein
MCDMKEHAGATSTLLNRSCNCTVQCSIIRHCTVPAREQFSSNTFEFFEAGRLHMEPEGMREKKAGERYTGT